MSLSLSGALAASAVACSGLCSQAFAGTAVAVAPPPVIILDRSIGGISYHETKTKVEKTHGTGRLIDLEIPGVRQIQYPWGIKVLYRRDKGTWLAMQVETRSARYHTPQGVGIGSTRKAVEALPKVRCHKDRTCGRSALPNGAGLGTAFDLDRHGRVSWIAIGNSSG